LSITHVSRTTTITRGSVPVSVAIEEGWFYGLEKIDKRVNLTPDKSARIKAGMFALILEKILEAKREIAKLNAAVQRMESAARAGTIAKPGEGKNFASPDIQRIRSSGLCYTSRIRQPIRPIGLLDRRSNEIPHRGGYGAGSAARVRNDPQRRL
jgi:hypothetical protein